MEDLSPATKAHLNAEHRHCNAAMHALGVSDLKGRLLDEMMARLPAPQVGGGATH